MNLSNIAKYEGNSRAAKVNGAAPTGFNSATIGCTGFCVVKVKAKPPTSTCAAVNDTVSKSETGCVCECSSSAVIVKVAAPALSDCTVTIAPSKP